MAVRDDLLAIERRLWSGGPSEYRGSLDTQCLIAFTEMAGVTGREDIAAQADPERWRDVDIKVEGFLQPTEAIAILTYRARATHTDGIPYEARVSSGYVKRSGGWKLMFHQQMRLHGPGAAAAR